MVKYDGVEGQRWEEGYFRGIFGSPREGEVQVEIQ